MDLPLEKYENIMLRLSMLLVLCGGVVLDQSIHVSRCAWRLWLERYHLRNRYGSRPDWDNCRGISSFPLEDFY